MKKILTLLVATLLAHVSMSQDIFKDFLFSVEHIMEHKAVLNLSEEQETQIRQIHNNSIPDFNNSKWDLDAEVVKLTDMISGSSVDVSASVSQLEKILSMENEIKTLQMRTLLEVKNILTLEQQTMLMTLEDGHKNDYIFISSVNEDPRVTVRVTGKVKGDKKAEPLFVIEHGSNQDIRDRIPKNIDPNEIESITVLKGGSATGLYGSKAKNGVVIIKLKD